MTTKKRVLLVLDHPAQHFSEAFRALASSKTIDASVLYWADDERGRYDHEFGRHVAWEADLLSGYQWVSLNGTRLRRLVGVVRTFRRSQPDMVVCYGWGTTIARAVILLSLVTRVPIVFYGDSTWQHSSRPALRVPRALVLRLLFRLAAGAISTGAFNREFYIWLGMHPGRVVPGVYPIDVTHYRSAHLARRTTSEGDLIVGFAGKLIPRKGVDELIHALGLLSWNQWRARIVGDGPERQYLERLAEALEIDKQVTFVGFRNTSEMPAEFALCDVLVVPSSWDLRILVAAEAMVAGVAVIVSSETAIWGSGDLIEHGRSGLVYTSGDPEDLANCLTLLHKDPRMLAGIATEGCQRATRHDAARFVESIEAAASKFA